VPSPSRANDHEIRATPAVVEPAPSGVAHPGRRVGAAVYLTVLSACALLGIGVLMRSTFTGYDITDEGFYLYAADPANKADVANGLWGAYVGLLYRAVGFSLVGFRIAGVVLLALCAGWLGRQVGGFLGFLTGRAVGRPARWALIVSTVSAACLYYALMILTPSYNWLALCGLMLTISGVLGMLTAAAGRPRPAYMALISTGCFLAFWGRNVAGVGIWVLAQALVLIFAARDRRDRLRLFGFGLATLVILGVLHAVFVLDPAATVHAVERAKSFNFTHGFSKPAGALAREAVEQVFHAPRLTYRVAGLLPLLGLAPALAWFARPRRRMAVAAAGSCAAVVAVGGVLVAAHGFDGGPGSYARLTPSVLALVVTAGLAWACCGVLRRRSGETAQGLDRRAALLVGVIAVTLLGTQALYAFTSNNALLGQSSGAAVLGLLAVALLLVAAVGRERLVPAVLSVAVLTPVALTVCMITGRDAPYRDAPLATATAYATINRHGARIRLAPQYAAYFNDLVQPARAAGFTPGTPLIDLTPFNPGAPEVLGAGAPNTLLFGYTTSTARWVLSVQDRAAWRGAWLLVRETVFTDREINDVTSVVGRSFPADYELVAVALWPFGKYPQQLWRPRAGHA
jgi:hypothetical protein